MFFLKSNGEKPKNGLESNGESWTGIISLWDIPYVETGKASNLTWLNSRISKFEREHPGVFIDVRQITPQRADMYFSGSADDTILPDIISIPPYDDIAPSNIYHDLKEHFSENELQRIQPLALRHISSKDAIYGVPTMVGTYALFLNKELLEEQGVELEENQLDYGMLDSIVQKATHLKKEGKEEIYYYGFGTYNATYSKPIISMIYNKNDKLEDNAGYSRLYNWNKKGGIIPEETWELENTDPLRFFLDGRIGVLLGNSRTLFNSRNAQSAGKGFELGVSSLPNQDSNGLFQDQIISYGLIKREDSRKKAHCVSFLKSLLEEEAQMDVKNVGMFPTVCDIGYIYEEDPEMHLLEKYNTNFTFGPRERIWKDNQGKVMETLRRLGEDSRDPELLE